MNKGKEISKIGVKTIRPLVLTKKGQVPTVSKTEDSRMSRKVWNGTDLEDGEYAINNVDNLFFYRSGNNILTFNLVSTNNQLQSLSNGITNLGLLSHNPVTTLDSTTIQFTLNGQEITAIVLESGIDHNSLSNLTTGNPHTQYALVGHTHAGMVINNGISTDNAIARFDGITGKIIENSKILINDDGNLIINKVDADFSNPYTSNYTVTINTTQTTGNGNTKIRGLSMLGIYNGVDSIYTNYGIVNYVRNQHPLNKIVGGSYGTLSYVYNEGGGEVTNMVAGYFSARNTLGHFNKLLGVQSVVNNDDITVTNNDVYGVTAEYNNTGVGDDFGGFCVYVRNSGTMKGLYGHIIAFEDIGTATNVCGIEMGKEHPWVGTAPNSYAFYIDSSTNVGTINSYMIYSLSTAQSLFSGKITAPNFISNVAIGTQPYACTSTTLNQNLNADMVDGYHATSLIQVADGVTITGNGSVGNPFVAAVAPSLWTRDAVAKSLYPTTAGDGFYSIGTTGTVPIQTTTGTRLMWVPNKASFRCGSLISWANFFWDDIYIGQNSVAMGYNTFAAGNNSVAIGEYCRSLQGTTNGLVMGNSSSITANYISGVAIGYTNVVNANYGHAYGNNANANGQYSMAIGNLVTAQAYSSLVVGRYNIISGTTSSWVTTDPLFVIGNGTGTGASASNALTVLKNGNVGIGIDTPAVGLVVFNNHIRLTDAYSLQWNSANNRLYNTLNDTVFVNNANESVRIKGTGFVGIKTNAPSDTLDVLGTARFGDHTTNYTQFEADGTMVAIGTATTYDDINTGLTTGKIPASNYPDWNAMIGNIYEYQFKVNDYIDCAPLELLHDWKEGSQIEIHVHWVTGGLNDATVRGVKWEVEYTWANMQNAGGTVVFPSIGAVSSETSIAANEAALTHKYTSVVAFTPTGGKIGAYLCIRLKRIASVTNVAPAVNPFGLAIGIHYEKDTMGSRAVSSK